jgi:serine O-acetyltransferase
MHLAVIFIHRISHRLFMMKVPFIPSLIAQISRIIFGCYIGPGARLGEDVVLGYGGLGVIIHGGSIVGNNVHIGAGVTLGGRSKLAGAPVIENNAVISGGAKVLGPITIGEGGIVGANAVVIKDVAPYSVVGGVPARVLKENIDIVDYHNSME